MGGSNRSPVVPEVSGSVSAKAAKNTHPTQSEMDRVCLTPVDAADVALIVVSLMIVLSYCTSAIEPVMGVGFALNAPLDDIELK